ncbi:MAG: serine/threonine-protein kinase [Pirellulales bacterium]
MSEERKTRIEDLFHRALEISDLNDRAAFLKRECAGDDSLYTAVTELLGFDGPTDVQLERCIDALRTTELRQAQNDAAPRNPPPKYPFLAPSDYPGSLGRLGKYEVLEQIGRGGMGLVFRAMATDLRREVAIKIQKSSRSKDELHLARFKTEARAVAQLDHNHIVRIYDVELDHVPPFLVMELVRGKNLAAVVKQSGPLPIVQAALFGIEAADGLQAAHDHDIVHRDVKPQNLMLTESGVIKVLDLGLARLPTAAESGPTDAFNLKYDSGVAGSVEFMSPEQTVSLADATSKSDIYSLGCTLFWLVTGKPPYSGDSPAETVKAHREAPRPSILNYVEPTRLNKRFDAVLQQMMALDPDDRQESMHDVIRSLEDVVRRADGARRLRRIIATASIITVAAVFLIGWMIWRSIPPKYDFELAAVSDLFEVRALNKLAAEIDEIQQWKTNYEKRAKWTAQAIFETPQAATFKECFRSGNAAEVGEVNKGLIALDRIYNSKIPSSWRNLSTKQLEGQIASALRDHHDGDVRSRVSLLLEKDSSKNILQRWGIPDFPSSQYPQRQDNWIAELKTEIKNHVAPRATWYETILAMETVTFDATDGPSVVLRPKADDIHFRGDESTASFALWLRFPVTLPSATTEPTSDAKAGRDGAKQSGSTRPKQVAEVDTGIRLLDCLLVRKPDGSVDVSWPAPSGGIDHGKFENALRYLDFPTAFELRDTKLTFDASAKKPSLTIAYEFAHEDLPACNGKNELKIDTTSVRQLDHNAHVYATTAQALPKLMRELESFRGFPIAISREDENHLFPCKLQAGKLPEFELRASLDEGYRIHFSGVPSVAVREVLAKTICDQSEALRGMEAFCLIDSFRLDKVAGQIVGNVAFKLPGEEPDGLRSKWSIDGKGQLTLVLIPEVRDKVAQRRTILTTTKRRPLEKQEIERRLISTLRRYPIPTDALEISSVHSTEIGSYFTLGLTIGDWPSLKLGPVEVTSLDEIESSVEQLLASSSVIKSANQQWQSTELHPRFGRSTAELLEWDSMTAVGKVQTTLWLSENQFHLDVVERVRFANGRAVIETQGSDETIWVPSQEYALSQSLKPTIKGFCRMVTASVENTTGVHVTVDVHDDDMTDPWLRLGPPRIRMQGMVRVPLINTDLGLGKIEIGQDAIQMPKSVIVQPRFTVHALNFNASDPSCEINWEEHSIQLGLKLTPPCPPLPVGALTPYDLQAYGIFGIPMSDIRWDNLCLHAGHWGIRADAKTETVGAAGSRRLVFGAESDLVLLDDIRVAQGRGEIAVRNWELERLGLRVDSEFNLVDTELGSMHANLVLVPNESMMLSGMTEVAGFGLRGDLKYDSRAQPTTIDVKALTQLEILSFGLEAQIRGKSNLAFNKYEFTADGSIPVPVPWKLSIQQLHYQLTATEISTKLDWWWETESGQIVHYVTEAPSIDLIDPGQLQQELIQVMLYSQSAQIVAMESTEPADSAGSEGSTGSTSEGTSSPGSDATAASKPIPGVVPPVAQGQENVVRVVQPAATEGDYGNPSIELSIEGDVMRIVTQETPSREIGRLTVKDVGRDSWEEVFFCSGWTPRDEAWIGLILFRKGEQAGALRQYLFRKDGSNDSPPIRVPADLEAVAAAHDLFEPTDWGARKILALHAVTQAMKMSADGYETVSVQIDESLTSASGSAPQFGYVRHNFYLGADEKQKSISFVGMSDTDRYLAIEQFATGIPTLPGIDDAGTFGNFVVAVNTDGGKTLCAVVQRPTRDQFRFILQTDDGFKEYPVQRIDGLNPWQIYPLAHQLAKSMWSRPVADDAVFYVGEAGACIVDSEGWQLIPMEIAKASSVQSFEKVSFESFVKWNSSGDDPLPSVNLLPLPLRQSESRAKADRHQIAEHCVMRWQRLKQLGTVDQRWQAQPMGLMLELVKSE